MQSLLADYLLFLAALFSLLPVGIALVHARWRISGVDLIGYGAAAGVVVQALFGLGIALYPKARLAFVLLDAAAATAAIVYVWRAGVVRELAAALSRPLRVALALWLGFAALCIAITHLEVTLPEQLPDGRYIFKGPTLNVKLQYLTTLPADNVIPYLVGEYLLRRISFRKERPLLPGQEMSNRPILMTLVALPYRAALSPPPRWKGRLGTFTYLGQNWPAVERLYDDATYRQVLVLGIVLNSLWLLGLLVLFQARAAQAAVLPCAMLLASSNFYFLSQTIFVWPKALAAFFLLLAWRSWRLGHSAAVVGLGVALAYHSHPYAGVFALGIGLHYLVGSIRERSLRAALVYAAAFGVAILPWFVWTRLILRLPSDLLWQNVSGPGTEVALASVANFIWVRLQNLGDLWSPQLFDLYPSAAEAVVQTAQSCLPGTVGIFLLLPALAGAWQAARRQPFSWWAIALPSVFLILLHSTRARPLLHGLQPIVGLLVFAGVAKLHEAVSPRWFWGIVLLQFITNLALLLLRGVVTGIQLP